jgi:subtilisin-like proprotein convertase family protein
MRLTAIVCLFVALLASVAVADVHRSEPNVAIPDAPNPGITTSLQASPTCTITDVNIALEVVHTWVGDLLFRVTHNAISVVIVDRPGEPATQFGCSSELACDGPIVLDDEANTPIETTCAPGQPFPPGTYRPNAPLTAFDGQDQAGQWDLFAQDLAQADMGTICAWEVRTTCVPTAVEPVTWGRIKEHYAERYSK